MNNFKNIFSATALAVMLLCMAGVTRADVKVTVRDAAEVRDEYIRLGDVADVEADSDRVVNLEDILLGKAPASAGVRTLSHLQIKARILAFGVAEKKLHLDGAESVRISRPAQKRASSPSFVEKEDSMELVENEAVSETAEMESAITEALRHYVRRGLNSNDARVTVKIISIAGGDALPAGARGMAVSRTAPTVPVGRARAELNILGEEGKSLATVQADVQVTVEVPVMVAKERITRNRIIEPDMIEARHVNIDSARTAYRSVGQVVGKRAKKSIDEGQILADGTIVVPPVVKRGQTVVVEARIGSMVVRHHGRAMDDAGAGELVMIRNSSSNGQYPARVSKDGNLRLVQ